MNLKKKEKGNDILPPHYCILCYLFNFNRTIKYSMSTWATALPHTASFGSERLAMPTASNNAYFVFQPDNLSRVQTHNYAFNKYCSLHPFLANALLLSPPRASIPQINILVCQEWSANHMHSDKIHTYGHHSTVLGSWPVSHLLFYEKASQALNLRPPIFPPSTLTGTSGFQAKRWYRQRWCTCFRHWSFPRGIFVCLSCFDRRPTPSYSP